MSVAAMNTRLQLNSRTSHVHPRRKRDITGTASVDSNVIHIVIIVWVKNHHHHLIWVFIVRPLLLLERRCTTIVHKYVTGEKATS